MPVPTVAEFVQALQKNQILESVHLPEFASLQAKYTDSKALAGDLLKRGWLSAFQVNLLLQGRCADLIFGDNVLLERLGSGGMGAVFKARQKSLERIIAVKMIRKEQVSNSTALLRFQQEARAVARLSHPNIVAIHEAGEANGTHYLAMEFMEGTDLSKLVKERGPLPIAQACEYIRQAALGLQHAHEQGMVHRDIKPHNLLLKTPHPPDSGGQGSSHGTRSVPATSPPISGGQGGVVKILDMGLARLGSATGAAGASAGAGEGEDETEGLTASGTIIGTVDYMAPEQADDSRKADIRADLYSLGCTLYYLLTGQVPYPGGDMLGKLIRHKLEEPAALESLRPDVPPAVAAVVRKMTAKDPKARYQTPAEVARALAPLVVQYRKSKPAGSTGILPVSSGSTGILPVRQRAAAGSTGILPVPAGSTGVSPVQHRLAAGATSEQTPTDEESSYTISAELSGRETHIDRPGRGGAALAVCGRLTRWPAVLWWRGLTQGSRRRRSVVAAVTLLVPLLLWTAWPAGKKASPLDKPGLGAKTEKELPAEPAREITNSIGMELVLIPAGTFRMGTPGAGAPEGPARDVEITKPFHMGKYEVTQAQLEKVIGVNNPAFAKDQGGGPNHAAEKVTWYIALEFCEAMTALSAEKQAGRVYRLPTEAEWEYACRADSQRAYSFGDDPRLLGQYGWFRGNAGGKPHPVGLLLPNAWGLCDMHGNVWEWCSDYYAEKYYENNTMIDP